MNQIDRTIKDIKSLKIQGAQNVADKALEALSMLSNGSYDSVDTFLKEVHSTAKKLSLSRPTEPALREAMAYVYFTLAARGGYLENMKDALFDLCMNYHDYLIHTQDEIAKRAKPFVMGNVYTHCHSGTVIKAIVNNHTRVNHVYASETRPFGQGYMTVKDLGEAKIKTTLVVDSAMGKFIRDCDVFVIGADAVTADGSLVNKIGSLSAAIIAKEYGVPMYSLTGTYKFDPNTIFEKEPLEERDVKEVYAGRLPKSVKIRNPAFDLVPAKYITGIITENGVVSPKNAIKVIRALPNNATLKL